ncbi:hypothetical protein L7F22_058934 [Adiantum nelumboides]|nr:hypothetical protein [Adiantum nelumboides]
MKSFAFTSAPSFWDCTYRGSFSRSRTICAPLFSMGSSISASATAAKGSSDGSHSPSSTALTDEEWKRRLTSEQYTITRKKGTERAFSGEYWNTKTAGIYDCRCCGTPLFDSTTKFDSGTGWPSYYQPIEDNVKSETDRSIPFMPRTEVLCAKCDAHLGHVFDDGPPPTGKRYCINRFSFNTWRYCFAVLHPKQSLLACSKLSVFSDYFSCM